MSRPRLINVYGCDAGWRVRHEQYEEFRAENRCEAVGTEEVLVSDDEGEIPSGVMVYRFCGRHLDQLVVLGFVR